MPNLSHYDSDQIDRMVYDEANNANRVTIVGADITVQPKIDLSSLAQKEIQIEKIEVPTIIKETDIKIVEVPKIITDIQIKEVIVERVVIQEKIQKIEVPVVIKEIEYREIEKPVVIEKIKEDKILNIFQIVQCLTLLGILVKLLFK